MTKEKGYLDMELLRFTTAGSVDDGKSTLIGRLLYDSKAIFQDQLELLEETSKQRGEDDINLALLTDGLRSESCLLYTSPSPRDGLLSRMPSSA